MNDELLQSLPHARFDACPENTRDADYHFRVRHLNHDDAVHENLFLAEPDGQNNTVGSDIMG